MLKNISSEIFIDNTINFHEGLNVVLGDNKGSNSIGKSTLLMILDFCFGGNSYTKHNSDAIKNLGHHSFKITFKFDHHPHEQYYMRGTENPEIVNKCNENFEVLDNIKVTEYTKELKTFYNLESKQLTFRKAVSPYSRIWGKENYNVKLPLHNFPKESYKDSITNLIKLFNEYDAIELQDKQLKLLEEQRKVLNSAGNYKLVPKITKREFTKNEKTIKSLIENIERMGKNVYSASGDIEEVVSDEMIKLRQEKKKLLDEREYYISRFNRTTKTIRNTSIAEFEPLLEFFENVNLEKLKNIESFHQGITNILTEELEAARQDLMIKIEGLDKEIEAISKKQDDLLKPDEELNVFIDSLVEMSAQLKTLRLENQFYLKLVEIIGDIDTKKDELVDLKEGITEKISKAINAKLEGLNNLIHENKRTAPQLKLTYSKYEYKFFDNTGTGKAYTNLLIFDLALLTLTKLPFIIHDSFLFKNIEKEAVEKVIKLYNSMSKQVFIAIDIINMYNAETQQILADNKVIQLSADRLLTTMDWRNNKQ